MRKLITAIARVIAPFPAPHVIEHRVKFEPPAVHEVKGINS